MIEYWSQLHGQVQYATKSWVFALELDPDSCWLLILWAFPYFWSRLVNRELWLARKSDDNGQWSHEASTALIKFMSTSKHQVILILTPTSEDVQKFCLVLPGALFDVQHWKKVIALNALLGPLDPDPFGENAFGIWNLLHSASRVVGNAARCHNIWALQFQSWSSSKRTREFQEFAGNVILDFESSFLTHQAQIFEFSLKTSPHRWWDAPLLKGLNGLSREVALRPRCLRRKDLGNEVYEMTTDAFQVVCSHFCCKP